MDFAECFRRAPALLLEGALGQRLKREYGLDIDGPVGLAALVQQEAGRAALTALWTEYLEIAQTYGLPFLATTPTRRANRERVLRAGYSADIIRQNVALLHEIRHTARTGMFIGGLMGCRGDAYTGADCLNTAEARALHSWQTALFRDAGVDFLYSGIMPTLPEAVGMAQAMADTGLPYLISFTIRRDGCLIDGTSIDAAIRTIDRAAVPPVCYMANCVHPAIVARALDQPVNRTDAVRARFLGLQANASALPPEALDGAAALHSAAPADLADAMLALHRAHPLKIFGGCCGTDGRHMTELARRLQT